MTTITPPPPPAPPPSAPRVLPTVTVSNPPAALSGLAKGSSFEGTVVSGGGTTTVQVSTAAGTIQIQTTLPLSDGAKLDLMLQSLSPQVRLQITTVDGKTPGQADRPVSGQTAASPGAGGTAAAGQSGGPAGTGLAAGQAPAGSFNPQSLVGMAMTGVLLRPEGSPANAAAFLVGGSSAQVEILPPGTGPTLSLSAANAGASSSGAPNMASGGSSPAGPGMVPAGAAAASGTRPPFSAMAPRMDGAAFGANGGTQRILTQGMQLPLRIVTVLTPDGGVPPPAEARAPFLGIPVTGQMFAATATGTTTTHGQPILHSPLGPIALASRAPIPRGATVTLQVSGHAIPPQGEVAESTEPAPRPLALFRASEWQTFREAYQVLHDLNASATHQLVSHLLPRADSHLAANILFFLSALRGGTVSGWFGDPLTRALQRIQPQLAERLQDEFRQMATLAREPSPGDWRIALVPFVNGPELEQLKFYLKSAGAEEDDEEAGLPGVRFIVDVGLSRLGRMQLDGLVRDEKKRMDLIVRSEEPLPPDVQNDLRRIFEEAVALAGKSGGLSFQAAPPEFIEVSPRGGPDENPDLIA